MATLSDLLSSIGAYYDLDTTTPTGDDLTVRTNFINQAQKEWANAYQWSSLRKTYALPITASAVSIALPADFKNLMSPVYERSTQLQYIEINPADQYLKTASDYYVTIGGNNQTGKYININPPIASTASLVFEYQSVPTSLTTLTDVSPCPNDRYLSLRSLAMLLESVSDPRFVNVKDDADRELKSMVEDEAYGSGGMNNEVPNYFKKRNFRLGYN